MFVNVKCILLVKLTGNHHQIPIDGVLHPSQNIPNNFRSYISLDSCPKQSPRNYCDDPRCQLYILKPIQIIHQL